MSRQILSDGTGNVIGEIKQQGSNLVIVDRYGNVKGTYNPRTNTTYDSNGNTVGTGNLLASLL
jgi:hypothetical protein